MTRVAVQAGAAWLRVAVDEPRPRVMAELPACELGPALRALFGGPLDELVVVHPVGARPTVPTEIARTVRTAESAVAAVAEPDGGGPERAVVVDVGHAGAEIALVEAGRVAAVRPVAAGGACLDAATRSVLARVAGPFEPVEARRVREALSLLPAVQVHAATAVLDAGDLRTALIPTLAAVVDAVRALLAAAGPGRAPPVVLVGGVARTPLLAELLDTAGIDGVRVAEQPDVAAVLGALRLPPGLTELVRSTCPEAMSAAPSTGPWLPSPSPARHRRARAALGALAAASAAAGLWAVGAALPPAGPDLGEAAPVGDVVQYGYAVRLPVGWAHTGGLPERRRSLLTPLAAPDGSDLVSVEQTPLGYDADTEPQRARAELRAAFAAAVAAGAPLSGFDDGARFAGRPVVAYQEVGGGEAGDVDWYVVLDGDAQLSVGCRHTAAGAAAVRSACATVVGSLHRTP